MGTIVSSLPLAVVSLIVTWSLPAVQLIVRVPPPGSWTVHVPPGEIR